MELSGCSGKHALPMSPRWVQYVAMDPVGDAEARDARLTQYREKRPPPWAVRQNIVGQQIPEPGDPARLTPLGRRLVGVDSWPSEEDYA